MGGTTKPALFLFSTLDGLIVGWNPGVNLTQTAVGADQSSSGAIYFGLALAGPASSPHLYAANGAGMIDVFDQSFNLVNSFAADPHPGLFTPYGIQVIGNNLYVTYAAVPPVFGGILDVCDLSHQYNESEVPPTLLQAPDQRGVYSRWPVGHSSRAGEFRPAQQQDPRRQCA